MAGKHSLDSGNYFDFSYYSKRRKKEEEKNQDTEDENKIEEQEIQEEQQNIDLEDSKNSSGEYEVHNNIFENYNPEEYYEEESSNKKIVIIICIIVVLIIVGLILFKVFGKKKEPVIDNTPVVSESKMIGTHNGYTVLGKIVIDSLGIEQYILDSKEDKALENGVIKLYGGSLNNYGNFCIAGHNYENVFEKISNLKVGDTFTIIDKNLEKTTYEVKENFSVEPDDLKCLMQNEEKIEITLITCQNGATTRTIVKAEEKCI